eukprot:Gregarina_sp_Pseudo_9__4666@NODE_485_length_2725_cov_6_155249_g457_i0_p3_GENE_NODE_485_length_2725_cov_6_155249_g457_i0NODE_485_length_2725_cov_6_155249_g457_i0_p3_ORF_typecomplete_len220_score52_23_NODE_485_length_2725_cov_6_155249_g457_i016042263
MSEETCCCGRREYSKSDIDVMGVRDARLATTGVSRRSRRDGVSRSSVSSGHGGGVGVTSEASASVDIRISCVFQASLSEGERDGWMGGERRSRSTYTLRSVCSACSACCVGCVCCVCCVGCVDASPVRSSVSPSMLVPRSTTAVGSSTVLGGGVSSAVSVPKSAVSWELCVEASAAPCGCAGVSVCTASSTTAGGGLSSGKRSRSRIRAHTLCLSTRAR